MHIKYGRWKKRGFGFWREMRGRGGWEMEVKKLKKKVSFVLVLVFFGFIVSFVS